MALWFDMPMVGKASIVICGRAVLALNAVITWHVALLSVRSVCPERLFFPHVDLSLRRHGQLVDPLNGRLVGKGCRATGKLEFKAATKFRYQYSPLYAAGFAAKVPIGARIKGNAKSPRTIARNASALVFWAAVFGATKDSRMLITIKKPRKTGRQVLILAPQNYVQHRGIEAPASQCGFLWISPN